MAVPGDTDPQIEEGEFDEEWFRRVMEWEIRLEKLKNFPTTPEALEEELRALPPDEHQMTDEEIDRMVKYTMSQGRTETLHDPS